jgi:hypothetical protein
MKQVSPGIYLVRTPVRESAGLTYGGPMRIKVGRRRVAYAGFVSVELAQLACECWSVRAEHFIEPWDTAIRHDSVEARVPRVFYFRTKRIFEIGCQILNTSILLRTLLAYISERPAPRCEIRAEYEGAIVLGHAVGFLSRPY